MRLSTEAYRAYVLRFWGGAPRTRGAVAFVLSLGCFLLAQASLVLPDLWLSHWSSLPPEQQED